MKNRTITALGAYCAFACGLNAADYYFTNAGGSSWEMNDGAIYSIPWSDANAWSATSGGGGIVGSIPGASDNIILNRAYIQNVDAGMSNLNLALNGDRTLNNITFERSSLNKISIIGTKNGGLQTITANQILVSNTESIVGRETIDNVMRIYSTNSTGNAVAIVTNTLQNSGNYASIDFGGNWNNMAISSLWVKEGIGTADQAWQRWGALIFNVNRDAADLSSRYDVQVDGVSYFDETSASTTAAMTRIALAERNNTASGIGNGFKNTFAFNGIQGNVYILTSYTAITALGHVDNKSYSTLIFTNSTKNTILKGWLDDTTTGGMNSSLDDPRDNGIQSGVIALKMAGKENFSQTILTNGSIGGGIEIESGTLRIHHQDSGWKRGDTYMSGGVLEIIQNEDAADISQIYAHIYACNFIWEGGTISVPSLSSEHIGATGKALIELDGAFSKGMSVASEFKFSYDLSLVSPDVEYKLVSWSDYTDFSEGDFSDDAFYYNLKGQYRIDETGKALYVSFVAIPEPSFMATVFGLLGILSVFYPRKK